MTYEIKKSDRGADARGHSFYAVTVLIWTIPPAARPGQETFPLNLSSVDGPELIQDLMSRFSADAKLF